MVLARWVMRDSSQVLCPLSHVEVRCVHDYCFQCTSCSLTCPSFINTIAALKYSQEQETLTDTQVHVFAKVPAGILIYSNTQTLHTIHIDITHILSALLKKAHVHVKAPRMVSVPFFVHLIFDISTVRWLTKLHILLPSSKHVQNRWEVFNKKFAIKS